QFGRNYLAKEVRVEGAAKLALRDRSDEVADTFRRQRSAAIADPERVTGDPRPRTTHQLRPVMGEIAFDPPAEKIREGDLNRTLVLGFLGSEGSPPGFAAALQTGADYGLCDI